MGDDVTSGQQSNAGNGPRAMLVEMQSGTRFELADKAEVTLGRIDLRTGVAPDLDLTSVDPQHFISRRHARILRGPGHSYLVIPEETTLNETYVNGQPLARGQAEPVHTGDSIILGAVQFWFEVHGQTSPLQAEAAAEDRPAVPERQVDSVFSEFAFGLNENVTADGCAYHVQTEDLGSGLETVSTEVLLDGAIVFSRRTPYGFFRERLGDGLTPEEMVRFQHYGIKAGIRSGKFKDRLTQGDAGSSD
jgi:pSer/pThr/pTyr-binding forkhead associated (FHA) protein